jgi:hypothetical protein
MEEEPQNTDNISPITNPLEPRSKKPSVRLILIIIFLLVVAAAVLFIVFSKSNDAPEQKRNPAVDNKLAPVEGLQLDPNKNYGDKYASGILPVGDNRYNSSAAEKGKVFLCNARFVPTSQAGAQSQGPWFIGNSQWDINKKYSVNGQVNWQQNITNKINGTNRVITTNNLPDHSTGTFPVASSDPAYKYDRNPNSIKAQSLTYSLAASPAYGPAKCMGGEVGVLLTGVALFNAFDAGGRDAGAWEIQDACEGHPQSSGLYHYHTLSSCIKDVGVNTVIGFALDGFPITGPKVGEGNFLSTDDLDECHGITSEMTLDNKKVTGYHYVMTQDFPYSVSCFRSEAIQPPGQHTGGTTQQPAGMPPQSMPSRPRP